MSATTYTVDDLIAGPVITDQVKMAADTYYRGMTLRYNTSTGRYEYNITAGQLNAVYNGPTLSLDADDRGSVIIGGEVNKAGLKNDSGAVQTITDDIIAQAALQGLYIKR
jgi:hypothetical protein